MNINLIRKHRLLLFNVKYFYPRSFHFHETTSLEASAKSFLLNINPTKLSHLLQTHVHTGPSATSGREVIRVCAALQNSGIIKRGSFSGKFPQVPVANTAIPSSSVALDREAIPNSFRARDGKSQISHSSSS